MTYKFLTTFNEKSIINITVLLC